MVVGKVAKKLQLSAVDTKVSKKFSKYVLERRLLAKVKKMQVLAAIAGGH